VRALTIASVVVPIFVNHAWQQLAAAIAVVYATVFVPLAASYKSTVGITIDTMDAWAITAHASLPDQFKTQHAYRERG
jgi:hypothetical protein